MSTFAADFFNKHKDKGIMTAEQRKVMLAFCKEQQRYNEALMAFVELVCEMSEDNDGEHRCTTDDEDLNG